MHDVFISYSTKNAVIADAVCNRLEAGGVRCWYAPRDVQAGKSWAGELMRAIRKAKVFLLIYSKDYNQSKQVISELTEAVDAGCTIVPFRVDQSIMNDDLAFYLKRIHWLDAINPPTQNQIENLYHHVVAVLGVTPPPPPPPEPLDFEEEKRRKEEAERKRQEQQRKRKEQIKRILLKAVLPAVLVLGLCAVAIWLIWGRDSEPEPNLDDGIRQAMEQTTSREPEKNQDPTEAPTQPEEPVEAGYQTIHFKNLSRLSQYDYPFFSSTMLSSNGEYIVLKNKESGTYTLGRTDNGSVYLSGVKLPDYEDPHMVQMFMTDGYDTIYFVDHLSQTVTSYDRTKKEWVNRQGTQLELKDTEYIFLTCGFTENMMEENAHKGELGLLIYDTDSSVDCISKLITVRPDGTMTVKDLSPAGLVDIINGVDRAGYSATLMVDKHRNLRVLDDQSGAVLELSHEDILQDYLPYISESNVICEDSRYYLSYESSSAQVWDLHTGSRVYSRTFADYAEVFFSAPHEIIVYNDEDRSVFARDLETGRETVLMDSDYFESQPIFMEGVFDFLYSREYDVCIFAVTNYLEEGNEEGQWRVIVTDRAGNILAVSEDLITYNGASTCMLYFADNVFLADMTLADWDTAQPEDGVVTELFRAEFTVDEAGNLDFK